MSGRPLPVRQTIDLFLVDLDNALAPRPGSALNLTLLAEIQTRNAHSFKDRIVPPLALMTGRPQPYLEAMQKVLGTRVAGVFEHGYGLFDATSDTVAYNPTWSDVAAGVRNELAQLCYDEYVRTGKGILQTGLHAPVSIIPQPPASVESLHYLSFRIGREFSHAFTSHSGPRTIDFIPTGIHRGIGLLWLAEIFQVPRERIAVMGGSTADLPAFREAGVTMCPANAPPTVRAEALHVTRGGHEGGVLEAYDTLIAHNKTA